MHGLPECVCCACDPSVRLDAHAICFVCVWYVGSCLLIKSLRAGIQVFALFMLFLCAILHNMWSGKSLHLLCILSFGMY